MLGDHFILIVEGLTFGAILTVLFYFLFSFNAFKKD